MMESDFNKIKSLKMEQLGEQKSAGAKTSEMVAGKFGKSKPIVNLL